MTTSRLSQFCDSALEAGWLVGVVITPVFFNVYSSRVFEPDKLTTLRALALFMAVLWLTRFVEERLHGGQAVRFSLETPLVLPALLTMAVYLISTAFSLVPFTSLVGSYQRLQGTYTLFAYLVLFFSLLTSLRERVQLSRLMTVLILNSLPISLYGIIQHNGLDPLPWAGDVTSRVASNMGNAIFVAAYLIMVVPLTAARIIESFGDILQREESRVSDILRASSYIFILAVQLLTIWYSRSRGPWLGLVAGGFLFPYLALLVLARQAGNEAGSSPFIRFLKGFGLGLGSLLVAGGIAFLSFRVLPAPIGLYLGLGGAGLTFGGIWLHFVVQRRGWGWLWVGWGTIGLTVALFLLLINIPGSIQARVRQVESLRRLTTITELQSGTGKVRGLIWQGTVDLISLHDPIVFPDGTPDRFNAIRPLVGYGPESMYVAYNAFYPPELGHYESRTASPDRSHNETLDSLVITGILGFAVYLFTFGSFFAWGLHWLGLLRGRRDLGVFIGISVLFMVTFFLIGWRMEGAYLFAVAVPLGLVVGSVVYLTYQGLCGLWRGAPGPEKSTLSEGEEGVSSLDGTGHPHALLIVALLAGVLAHFVEINFGIAIAATRTMFWTFAGLLVVLGSRWVPGPRLVTLGAGQIQGDGDRDTYRETRGRRYSRRARSTVLVEPWQAAVVALSLMAAFLLGTLAYDFINNPERLTRAGQILVRSLTMKYYPRPTRAYGALMIFAFTWLLFGVVGLGEFDRESLFEYQRRRRWRDAIILYGGLSLMGSLLFGGILAGHQAALARMQVVSFEEIVDVAERLTGLLGRYYALIFGVVGGIGWILMAGLRRPRFSASLLGGIGLVVLGLLSVPVIQSWSYNLIRADIIYKQGGGFANSAALNEKQVGILHYERAIEYAPREDYYYLFLGKAYLELAQGLPDTTPRSQREEVFLRAEEVLKRAREINPLNTDHSANLARFYKSWAARIALDLRSEELSPEERTQLEDKRHQLLTLSLENYQIALRLSPHNPILWNELAQLYAVELADPQKFEATIAHSLELDDGFEQTWMLLGDIRSAQGDIEGAIEAYQRSLEIRENCTVRRVVGTLLAQEERWEDAIQTLETSLEKCDGSREAWEIYRVLAIAYANLGRIAQAQEAAVRALELAPAEQQAGIQQLLDQLKGISDPGGPSGSP